jgi:DNA-binding response OmpR family regulator
MFASACVEAGPQLARRSEPVRLLTVGIEDSEHDELSEFLREPECRLYRADARLDALRQLRTISPDVVICEQHLQDGTWKDVLADLQSYSRPPMLIVCSLLADDRLWAEVLNIGGYDVLMKPFRLVEVVRVVDMAADRR